MITLYTMEREYPYGALRSTNGSKVKVVLAEKGLDFQTQTVRPGDVWKKLPEVLAKHPLGKVPWIDDGDLTLYDSTVINEYLNEKSAANPLLPLDLQSRSKVRALENYGDEGVLAKFLPMIWMPSPMRASVSESVPRQATMTKMIRALRQRCNNLRSVDDTSTPG